MMRIETEVMSMQDIWSRDKQLLRGYNPTLKVNWDAPLPTNEEAHFLLIEKEKRFSAPENPMEVNESTLKSTLDNLEEKVRKYQMMPVA